ncbi:MAG: M4 family metallopeptidase [Crocinitomix sp.]|nr:M4 family metallopeptidase [Crocinitomix sp.]
MNYFKPIIFSFVFFGFFSKGAFGQNLLNDLKNLQEIETVRDGQFSTLPSYLKFKKGSELAISEFEQWIKTHLQLAPEFGFQLLSNETDNLGHLHYRYQQTFKGLPLEDAIWIAHTINNKVYSCNGLIYKNFPTNTAITLSETDALTKAIEKVNAETYKWELPNEEAHLKWESGNPAATYYPKGELVFVATGKNFEAATLKLVYKFNIYAQKPLYRANVYVDANSGEIVRENLLIHHADTPGTAQTAYSGPQPIIADSFEGAYRLRDGSRGNGIRTFDLNTSTEYGSAVDFIDLDNDWNNINPELDEYATDVHWGTERAYDYFFENFDRNSIDNDGFQLNSYVHYDFGYFNAFWDGERLSYGDGGLPLSPPITTIDIVGHEITHGLTANTANLLYESEAGGLNESFSDIFGTAIEEFSKPGEWNWLIGTETGTTFRSMSDPKAYTCPDTYRGEYWEDFGLVHRNSGVQNHWFYLLTMGGAGINDLGDTYEVVPIGIDDASSIAFRNLTVYLTPTSNYEDARFYSALAAEDLFGLCSEQVVQTVNAWYAVGVGEPYTSEVIADFSFSEVSGCRLPFSVSFENEGSNGDSYLWNFGDGTTSTDENPTHVYTTEGEFDVSLEIDGADCAGEIVEDLKIIEALVVITEDEACPYNFPVAGIGAALTSCDGTLFDSGGADGNYGIAEVASLTISPIDALTVQLDFVTFDVQGEDLGDGTCFYDVLSIYDGPDESYPLIGHYCNGVLSPGTVNSTGPSISLYFYSDINEASNEGFEIQWSCTKENDDLGITTNSAQKGIIIYPNPTNNLVNIVSQNIQNGLIEVRDVTGRKLLSTQLTNQLTQVNLANYQAKGLYFIHVLNETGETIVYEKVVLN